MGNPFPDYAPGDVPDSAWISESRRLADTATLLLEHPKIKADDGHSGLYETGTQARATYPALGARKRNAEEFDVLLYLICNLAEGLAFTLSELPIP